MFKVEHVLGRARAATLTLAHGEIKTPVFMPVATNGAIKGIVPEDLETLGAQIILANTYHMFLRPGVETLKKFSGLHNFMQWKKPILTDSGGFQIYSLGKFNKLTEEGAHFQSHIDGSSFSLTPESVVEIQEVFGSDIHMVLDECTAHPVTMEHAESSMERSMRWAARARKVKQRSELCQFGIVQGNVFKDLRKRSIYCLGEIGFEGYAIGGLSVGEEKPAMREMTEYCCELLPQDKPRYLMGVGTPLDLIESVAMGVDMFDCVMPSRNARRGTIFTSHGRLNMKNQIHTESEIPLDANCSCYTCKTFSRSFLRHMFFVNEITSYRLLTLHNLTYYVNLMTEIRASIIDGTFTTLLKHHQGLWKS